MDIDITPSLAEGELKPDVLTYVCGHYSFIDVEGRQPVSYVYISRAEPLKEPEQVNDGLAVHSLLVSENRVFNDILLYSDKAVYHYIRIPLRYFRVANPNTAGAVGIVYGINDQERIMAVSGALTGCGFAVLTRGRQLYLIHAGGASGASRTEPDAAEARRMLVNRDIYLMARVLRQRIDGPQENALREEEIQNGIGRRRLFELIRNMGFKGFMAIPAGIGEEKSIWPKEEPPLYLRTYFTVESKHDVLCVINENGIMSVGFREMKRERTVEACERYIKFQV